MFKKTISIDDLPNTITVLNLNYDDLYEFPDLSRFTNLKELYITKNNFITIPKLPNTLKILDCSWNNSIRSFHSIPPNLVELHCQGNKLSYLPLLPDSLEHLSCGSNKFDFIPPLPSNLKNLFCMNNNLSMLPKLPNTLTHLDCSKNKIKRLPICSINLRVFSCSHNKLTEIPKSYSNVILLYCSNNDIISLPFLSNKLAAITCYNTWLYSTFNLDDVVQYAYFMNTIVARDISRIINKINKFKYAYNCVKFKIQFMKWLWKTREKIAIKLYHPSNLIQLLNTVSEEEIDEILEKW
jgi:Leucine-rich repeat (LRR) protein